MRDVRQLRADGVRETDVRDQAFAEKCGDTAACAVDELVRDHEVQRLMFFLERTDGAERKNALDAQHLHAVNVGAEVQLRWGEAMPAAVARQKRDLLAGEIADHVRIRRAHPRACPLFALPALQIRASNTIRCRQ